MNKIIGLLLLIGTVSAFTFYIYNFSTYLSYPADNPPASQVRIIDLMPKSTYISPIGYETGNVTVDKNQRIASCIARGLPEAC